MTNYAQHFSTRQTPQSEQAHPEQRENNAGGYAFVVDDWTRLERFLVLGSDGGTYYVGERKLTVDNAKCVQRCLVSDAKRAIDLIVEMSVSGRAPKNSPAIFALAIAAGSEAAATRKLALEAMPKVCRIGTHLFEFLACVQNFRGWGRALRKAVGLWYTSKSADDLAYQLVKYQSRHKWSHRDALRKCHVADKAPQATEAAIRWAVAGIDGMGSRDVKRGDIIETQPALKRYLPEIIKGYESAKSAKDVVPLIDTYGLTREMLPTEHLNSAAVWEALLRKMPMTAMIRNLGKMTSIGLIAPMSDVSALVADRLGDVERLRKARVHPIALLTAMRVYQSGRGIKGSLRWAPDPRVVDALDAAFYLAFQTVEPTGKNFLLALDVSGSMGAGVLGLDFINCREASAALALVTANVEQTHHFVAFTGGGWGSSQELSNISPLDISPRQRLDDVIRTVRGLPFGGTDCALPMLWAEHLRVPVDVFVILTDNESRAGRIHAHQALEQYRQKMGRPAKLVACAMAATEYSVANADDAGQMNVCGFDAATPRIISDFVAG